MPWLGWGAAHWNCRRVIIPIVKSWKELGLPGLEEMSPAKRRPVDGKVADTISMDTWLNRKSAAAQDKILGKGKAKLWRDGDIALPDLVDQWGRPKSLKDLNEGLERKSA